MVPLLLILLLLGLAVFGDKGLLRALQFRRQQAELELRLRELEQTNAALRKEIEALRSDRRRIEAIARKELGLVRDDELIYQFPARVPAAKPIEAETTPGDQETTDR